MKENAKRKVSERRRALLVKAHIAKKDLCVLEADRRTFLRLAAISGIGLLFGCGGGGGDGQEEQLGSSGPTYNAKCYEAALYSAAVIDRHADNWEIVEAPVIGEGALMHAECRALIDGRWWWIEPSPVWGWAVMLFDQPCVALDLDHPHVRIYTDLAEYAARVVIHHGAFD